MCKVIPVVFWDIDGDQKPFPLDAFPDIIRNAILEYIEYGSYPLPMVAASTFSAISLACQGYVNVARDWNLVGPTSLNFITVVKSGGRKSSTDKHYKTPIERWAEAFIKNQKKRISDSKVDYFIWEMKKNDLINKIKKDLKKEKSINEFVDRLKDLEANRPNLLFTPEIFYTDTNPAALGESLTCGHPSAAIWSAEGAEFVGSHGMSGEYIMRYLSILNNIWDGSGYKSNRKTVSGASVEGVRLSCSLMMQNVIMEHLLKEKNGLVSLC